MQLGDRAEYWVAEYLSSIPRDLVVAPATQKVEKAEREEGKTGYS